MSGGGDTLSDLGWRRIAFTLFVLVPLAVWAFLLQGWRNQVFLVTSWFGVSGPLPPEFLEIGHRLHEVAFAIVLWPLLIGLLTQFRSPKRHIAGMWMALINVVALGLAFSVTDYWVQAMVLAFFGVPTLLAMVAHPAGRDLVGRVRIDRVNRVALALVIVAAVPLLAFTATQVGLQTGAIEPDHGAAHDEEVHQQHVEFGHFMIVVAMVFGIIGVGLLASLQPAGWWVAAWLAGTMAVVYGLASVAAPAAASNPGLLWSVGAIVWGVGFVAAAEVTQDGSVPSYLAGR